MSTAGAVTWVFLFFMRRTIGLNSIIVVSRGGGGGGDVAPKHGFADCGSNLVSLHFAQYQPIVSSHTISFMHVCWIFCAATTCQAQEAS